MRRNSCSFTYIYEHRINSLMELHSKIITDNIWMIWIFPVEWNSWHYTIIPWHRIDTMWSESKSSSFDWNCILKRITYSVHRTVWRASYAALNFMYQFRMQNMSWTSNNIKFISQRPTKNALFPIDSIFNSINFMSIQSPDTNIISHTRLVAHVELKTIQLINTDNLNIEHCLYFVNGFLHTNEFILVRHVTKHCTLYIVNTKNNFENSFR